MDATVPAVPQEVISRYEFTAKDTVDAETRQLSHLSVNALKIFENDRGRGFQSAKEQQYKTLGKVHLDYEFPKPWRKDWAANHAKHSLSNQLGNNEFGVYDTDPLRMILRQCNSTVKYTIPRATSRKMKMHVDLSNNRLALARAGYNSLWNKESLHETDLQEQWARAFRMPYNETGKNIDSTSSRPNTSMPVSKPSSKQTSPAKASSSSSSPAYSTLSSSSKFQTRPSSSSSSMSSSMRPSTTLTSTTELKIDLQSNNEGETWKLISRYTNDRSTQLLNLVQRGYFSVNLQHDLKHYGLKPVEKPAFRLFLNKGSSNLDHFTTNLKETTGAFKTIIFNDNGDQVDKDGNPIDIALELDRHHETVKAVAKTKREHARKNQRRFMTQAEVKEGLRDEFLKEEKLNNAHVFVQQNARLAQLVVGFELDNKDVKKRFEESMELRDHERMEFYNKKALDFPMRPGSRVNTGANQDLVDMRVKAEYQRKTFLIHRFYHYQWLNKLVQYIGKMGLRIPTRGEIQVIKMLIELTDTTKNGMKTDAATFTRVVSCIDLAFLKTDEVISMLQYLRDVFYVSQHKYDEILADAGFDMLIDNDLAQEEDGEGNKRFKNVRLQDTYGNLQEPLSPSKDQFPKMENSVSVTIKELGQVANAPSNPESVLKATTLVATLKRRRMSVTERLLYRPVKRSPLKPISEALQDIKEKASIGKKQMIGETLETRKYVHYMNYIYQIVYVLKMGKRLQWLLLGIGNLCSRTGGRGTLNYEDALYEDTVDDNMALRIAAAEGDLKEVKRLLGNPQVDPSSSNNDALRSASMHGHRDIVLALLRDHRTDVPYAATTILQFAGESGWTDIVSHLATSSNVDIACHNNACMRGAVLNGHMKIFEVLLRDSRIHQLNDYYTNWWRIMSVIGYKDTDHRSFRHLFYKSPILIKIIIRSCFVRVSPTLVDNTDDIYTTVGPVLLRAFESTTNKISTSSLQAVLPPTPVPARPNAPRPDLQVPAQSSSPSSFPMVSKDIFILEASKWQRAHSADIYHKDYEMHCPKEINIADLVTMIQALPKPYDLDYFCQYWSRHFTCGMNVHPSWGPLRYLIADCNRQYLMNYIAEKYQNTDIVVNSSSSSSSSSNSSSSSTPSTCATSSAFTALIFRDAWTIIADYLYATPANDNFEKKREKQQEAMIMLDKEKQNGESMYYNMSIKNEYKNFLHEQEQESKSA